MNESPGQSKSIIDEVREEIEKEQPHNGILDTYDPQLNRIDNEYENYFTKGSMIGENPPST